LSPPGGVNANGFTAPSAAGTVKIAGPAAYGVPAATASSRVLALELPLDAKQNSVTKSHSG
jgi:hypothetical protein